MFPVSQRLCKVHTVGEVDAFFAKNVVAFIDLHVYEIVKPLLRHVVIMLKPLILLSCISRTNRYKHADIWCTTVTNIHGCTLMGVTLIYNYKIWCTTPGQSSSGLHSGPFPVESSSIEYVVEGTYKLDAAGPISNKELIMKANFNLGLPFSALHEAALCMTSVANYM